MSGERRRGILLVALAALLAFAAVRFGGALLSGRGGTGFSPPDSPADNQSRIDLPQFVELRLGELENKPAEFNPGRDPFGFYTPPPPPPPPAPPRQKAPTGRPQPKPASTTPQKPKPPPVTVTFLGSFGPVDRRIAVFTDGNDLYNARVGDVVKEHFVVDNIGFESSDLKYVNFPEEPPARLAVGG
ncbi:MAG: hypothetical protein OES47_00150 [Acidobacteriota bacterium]|nr:hypothetical protein [Acidobacteriota bacterium]